MKKILFVLVLFFAFFLNAEKIAVSKKYQKEITHKQETHPLEKRFGGVNKNNNRMPNSDKLLILLLEFSGEEEIDNSETTGNGCFVQDPANYPISIGKPPHDYGYFMDISEALKEYYLAVSYETYSLNIDVCPISESGDFHAYKLPETMSYYNPGMSDSDLMVERFQQYFYDAFAVAEQDSTLNFSDYGHYMFIHAGSDWQHDVLGDTPHDIPSFFIEMDENPFVTESGFEITHACNIPETITQDVEVDSSDVDFLQYSRYGVINAVMVHEFGHSIGFVDLYNTKNHTPQVGYYDIMDSGGSTILGFGLDEDGDGTADAAYYFEGVFPALPSVFSRLIPFEDVFRQNNILKDISELYFGEKITIFPAESKDNFIGANSTHFVKIPINDDEYYLIENRQVDPDGDGGTYVWATDDGRVILHPTYPPPNPDESNNYEYDYLLPGWVDEQYRSIGGGLLIWHIDEKILYQNNNFENNTVNIYHDYRAVKIVEADNIDDIGNPYSMYWKGTAYEPFYKYKPLINEDGFFTGWDDDYIVNPEGEIEFIGKIFNNELSATSNPAFVDNSGNPSIFSIYDISSYAIDPFQQRNMSFKFGTNLFDETHKIAEFDSIKAIGLVGQFENYPIFPVVADEELKFFTQSGNSWQNIYETAYLNDVDFPIATCFDNENDRDKFTFVSENSINFVNTENSEMQIFFSNVSGAPLLIENWYSPLTVIPTEDSLFVGDFALNIQNAKCTFDGEHLIVASENKIQFIPDLDLEGAPYYEVEIANYDPKFLPVSFDEIGGSQNDATFVQNANGDIFKIKDDVAEKIFSLAPYSDKAPSQLALCKMDEQIYLTFGAENRVFAITLNGTLKSGFPTYLEHKSIKSEKFPRVIKFGEDIITLLEEENGGYVAIDQNGDFRMEYSFYWRKNNLDDHFYWDEITSRLYYIYADKEHKLYSAFLGNITENPIMWNGFRNGKYSIFENEITTFEPETETLVAFAFPNPARNGEVRIRVENAAEKIEIKIFNIAGNLLENVKISKENNLHQDFRWDVQNIASGVYFAIVKSGSEMVKIPFAVIH
ncbi:MAG: T9SS type A sorting domain-containing protein [Candidatus Cloacimonetes bacterium]|jgi:M6 family metalloprotease-like protein|nr:T9SS type A sorting domain-containing protein [Candidatus Cloacimonadota bacterium]MBT6993985.1 T9SS type A sorting domain-containing protein [Candidatus Cloacimonadota bacterium]MBT7469274.1 T9SS type A sorting domain-containing protein [Candidatus Cloacimonadota bacterium]